MAQENHLYSPIKPAILVVIVFRKLYSVQTKIPDHHQEVQGVQDPLNQSKDHLVWVIACQAEVSQAKAPQVKVPRAEVHQVKPHQVKLHQAKPNQVKVLPLDKNRAKANLEWSQKYPWKSTRHYRPRRENYDN